MAQTHQLKEIVILDEKANYNSTLSTRNCKFLSNIQLYFSYKDKDNLK